MEYNAIITSVGCWRGYQKEENFNFGRIRLAGVGNWSGE